MSMEGVKHGEPGATARSTDLNQIDTEESDLQLVKAVSEMAAHLTPQERAVLTNARSRLDDIMGPSFLERMGRSFFFPSGDNTDGLTSLDLELLGERRPNLNLDPSSTIGGPSSANTTKRAAVALQQLTIGRKKNFDFLELPREIRDQIYNYCLVTDFDIVMYPEDYEIADVPSFWVDSQPCVSMLQLNRQVYQETFPVFYGKNVFRIPTDNQYNATYQKYGQYIHHVSIHLDYREVTDSEKQAIAIAEHMTPDTAFAPTRPDAARWRQIHKRHLDLMTSKWQPRHAFITLNMTALDTIKLDLSWYYCPGLCCRKAIIYSDLFHQFVNGTRNWIRNGGRIEVHGLATDLEENIMSTPRWQSYAKLP